jgi:hypothetical protein
MAHVRHRKRVRPGFVALGLVLVTSVSGCSGGGARSSGAPSGPVMTEAAYATALAPIATNLLAAMTPTDNVLEKYEAFTADAFSARDALEYSVGVAAMAGPRRRLAALRPPAALTSDQHQLITAAATMATALTGLTKLWSLTTYAPLSEKLDSLGERTLGAAQVSWNNALRAIFTAADRPAPSTFTGGVLPALASQTSWIFGADLTCSATYAALRKPIGPGRSAADKRRIGLDRLATALSSLGSRLADLPEPDGAGALPDALLASVGELSNGGSAFSQLSRAINHHNQTREARARQQLSQQPPTGLSENFRAYGAFECSVLLGNILPALERSAGVGEFQT